MNKKGFTLVELLAVIVVLVIVLVIAITRIKKVVDNSSDKTIEANAGVFIKAVNNAASNVNIMEDSIFNDGVISYQQLIDAGVSINGTKPDSGYVIMSNYEVSGSCLTYGNYKITYSNGKFDKPVKGRCGESYAEYAYTGEEKVFEAPMNGVYKLEAWGAQGGSKDASHYGGYGGYTVGYLPLKLGEKIYINVGGRGNSDTVEGNGLGGYNGGGRSGSSGGAGGGGGATSIAFSSGLLSSFSASPKDVILVAAGGAGHATYGCNTSIGGNGGGYIGSPTSNGGTQTAGGTSSGQDNGIFGAGAYNNNTGVSTPGAGAGFYGGGTVANGCTGGGGSSFIGNYRLRNATMYCKDCQEINTETVKTTSVSCAEDEPTENCAKKNSGFARISYYSGNDLSSDRKYLYSIGNEFTSVTGGWVAENTQTNGRTEKLNDSLHIYCSRTGSSGSRYHTANAIDTTGYTKINIVYQIVSQLTSNDYAKLSAWLGPTSFTSPNMAVGIYHESFNIVEESNNLLYIQNVDANMKILQVWLSKD